MNAPTRELAAFWAGVAVLLIALVLDGTSRLVAGRQLRVQAARRALPLREFLRESADPTVVTVFFEDTVDVLGAALRGRRSAGAVARRPRARAPGDRAAVSHPGRAPAAMSSRGSDDL
jgi:hypothetical protein